MAILLGLGLAAPALGAEAEYAAEPEDGTLDNLADADELFARYVNIAFGLEDGEPVRLRGISLSGRDLLAYRWLETQTALTADGGLPSAVFQIPLSALGVTQKSYTAQELGLSSFTRDNINAAIASAAFTHRLVLTYLGFTRPYNLYWYDKTKGYTFNSHVRYTSSRMTFSEDYVTVSLRVSADYSVTGETGTTDVDTGRTAAASRAAAAAAEVAERYEDLPDYEKLTAYKDYICGEVSYNRAAASDSGTPYGDPWQMIYVFDGDKSTNVVCEGYAKAFQYLCDLSLWRGSVSCVSVSGKMNGGSHMWNIVTIGGKNYLADITNSDSTASGRNGQLFLTGYSSGSAEDGYVFRWDRYELNGYSYAGSSVTYVYDSKTTDIYDTELVLSAEDYDPGSGPAVVNTGLCGKDGASLPWTLDEEGTLSITGEGEMEDYAGIGLSPWYDRHDQIRRVFIAPGAANVGDYAFAGCENLTYVSLPASVTRVGEGAFLGCAGLTKVRFVGAERQWDDISPEEGNDTLQEADFDFGVATGDVNGDDIVDLRDLELLRRYLAGWDDSQDIDIIAADVNHDTIVDRGDRIYLARYLAGWDGYSLF